MAAAPPPPPPPPPPPSPSPPPESNQEKKISSKLPMRRRYCGRFGSAGSSKVPNPILGQSRKSFIWPWLEGKLEKEPSRFSGEESSSSAPGVPNSVPTSLSPMPISVVPPKSDSNMMEILVDASSTELYAVYDPFQNRWYYISSEAYNAMFDMKFPEEDLFQEENVKEENATEEKEVEKEEKEVEIDLPPQQEPPRTILIGEIEVPLPPQDSVQVNINPSVRLASSSEEHGRKNGSAGRKKGKKKKNKGKKKLN